MQRLQLDTLDLYLIHQPYGYVHGEVVPGSGHLQVTVSPERVKVDFLRASLSASQNGQVLYSYTIAP